MEMIEDGSVVNTKFQECGIYTVGKTYEVNNGMIIDDEGGMTNFGNVRRSFKAAKLNELNRTKGPSFF